MRSSGTFEFVFIEPSSSQELSYPAEIYWGTIPRDNGAGHLINPSSVSRWEHWSMEFFERHQITQTDVQTHGTHPPAICNAIIADLAGKTIYAREPLRTQNLLGELFSAVNGAVCSLVLEDLDGFWRGRMANRFGEHADARLEEIERQVLNEHPGYQSGGAFQRPYYAEIWKRILKADCA